MADTIKFETYRARLRGDAEQCNLCDSRSALLQYLVRGDDGVSQILDGYCCSVCAFNLVEALAQRQLAGFKKTLDVEATAGFES